MTPRLGLYVHIPFCLRKCAYCDFPSRPGQLHLREDYTRALCREIRERGEALGHPAADTLFIGGGTPSLMSPGQMGRILAALRAAFPWGEGMEASCEANPETLTPAFAEALAAGGVNRLSLGAQASQDSLLRAIGRGHSWAEVERAAGMARAAGIPRLNLDVMSGLPGQSPAQLRETLDAALAVSPEHLSCYSLILEEGTALHERVRSGAASLPDEETLLEMDALTRDMLARAGYIHYEVSNYALPGCFCRHNLNCWEYADYLGFGAAAAGFYQGVRRRNPADAADYLAGRAPEESAVSAEDSRFEQLMLGLRLTEGLDAARFEARQGIRLEEAFGRAIDRNVSAGLLYWGEGRLRLSRRGFMLMNRVLLDFLP